MDLQKIEEKLDKTVSAATPINMDLGGIQLESMVQMMELAKAMALSGPAIPAYLRGNPGACLAIWIKATRFNFEPFALAEHSYVMVKKSKNDAGNWVEVETVAFDSFVLRAIINAHAPIEGGIVYSYEGEGDERVCIATAKRKDNGQTIMHRSAKLGVKLAGMKRNDRGEIKGSPLWSSPKSDVQFAYDTGRDLCRIHFPETLLGWYDKEEMEEAGFTGPDKAKDITPNKPAIGDRLKGNKGRGFNAEHVQKTTEKPQDGQIEVKATETTESGPAPDGKAGEEREATPAQSSSPSEPEETVITPELIALNLITSIKGNTDKVRLEEWQNENNADINALPPELLKGVRKALDDRHLELAEP